MSLAILFDLDGTLVDTPTAIVETFTAVFASLGVPPPDGAAIRTTIGIPLDQAFARLLGAGVRDDQVALSVTRYQALFRELVLPRAPTLLFPGVARGLAALRARGLELAVATSKVYASADALLRAAGIREHFSVVVGADQVTRPKPDPETGHLIMQKLRVPAGRAVMVGDTTHDLWMAKAAGMRSVAVTYGVHDVEELKSSDPTWIADTFDDVLERLQTGFLES